MTYGRKALGNSKSLSVTGVLAMWIMVFLCVEVWFGLRVEWCGVCFYSLGVIFIDIKAVQKFISCLYILCYVFDKSSWTTWSIFYSFPILSLLKKASNCKFIKIWILLIFIYYQNGMGMLKKLLLLNFNYIIGWHLAKVCFLLKPLHFYELKMISIQDWDLNLQEYKVLSVLFYLFLLMIF